LSPLTRSADREIAARTRKAGHRARHRNWRFEEAVQKVVNGSRDLIRLAGSTLDRSRHVCALFHGREDEYRVLLPFIKEGIDRGEKAFHIVDPALRSDHLERLARVVDVARAEHTGQLEVRTWEAIYLRGGHFDQGAMLVFIADALEHGRAEGFPLTRFVASMNWAVEDRPGVGDIVAYEARLNAMLPTDDPVI
jgi:hypothetical protein